MRTTRKPPLLGGFVQLGNVSVSHRDWDSKGGGREGRICSARPRYENHLGLTLDDLALANLSEDQCGPQPPICPEQWAPTLRNAPIHLLVQECRSASCSVRYVFSIKVRPALRPLTCAWHLITPFVTLASGLWLWILPVWILTPLPPSSMGTEEVLTFHSVDAGPHRPQLWWNIRPAWSCFFSSTFLFTWILQAVLSAWILSC